VLLGKADIKRKAKLTDLVEDNPPADMGQIEIPSHGSTMLSFVRSTGGIGQ
jgi:hypothetical protein